ncbi:unnamed protein product [Acanthoscelides obtectus]|uniref:Macro domain-containing protein n=1 Tax=Acanthoscelides obtectus TaxID=200917 RepID=A0A9P0QBS5_ACAOB|nr:unnamed protein product [Acanthoscelides obtectus]CAH2016749.1 unnamed protein product [Acanthoscelides obtectus]CAK1632778.1 O-acetyl-ADP-ribose deacetylase 1 [Acanthoscelides obtectus]CAK1633379.1 O-acetyl-ADP-ribose deacetylase 1 [Acanthoscelides obtectus]
MLRGIAKVFLRIFGRVYELRQTNPEVGEVLQITEEGTNRKIFYLVTKEASHQKPNYEDVWSALCSLREVLLAEDLRKLAIPKLACGLDNLDWRIIRSMLEVVFRYTDIRFLVCCHSPRWLHPGNSVVVTSSRTPTARKGSRADIDIHHQ